MAPFHDRHICDTCGQRYAGHAGPGNPHCPENRCPGKTFPRWDAPTEQFLAYWNERSTTFKPR